jgi:UDP-N-acetyl-D-mannosaminuronic acid dehydrogenase
MKVCVIGLGYIGFPTACVIADAGHEVIGVDVNVDLVEKLNNGGLHIVNEDGLADLAKRACSSGYLRVSDHPEKSDVFILAVPTPLRHRKGSATEVASQPSAQSCGDGKTGGDIATCVSAREAAATAEIDVSSHAAASFRADLSYVKDATHSIAPFVKAGDLVILESTVPPGTTANVVCNILQRETGLDCSLDILVAHAPERVLPGNMLHELKHNDRIVGGMNVDATECAVAFYKSFVLGDVIGTDATTAETVKLMENTFRDVNIALANEFALIAERLGVDVFEAISLANRHPRVSFLKPGPGVGGHCIPIDPYFIIQSAPEEAQLIKLARCINSYMTYHVLCLLESLAQEAEGVGKRIHTVGVLGASYKANVGDERESPSLEIACLAENKGYDVIIHDPYIERFAKMSLKEVIQQADALILLTDHDVYKSQLTTENVKSIAGEDLPWILDTRGFFDSQWDAEGYRVRRLGVGE